VWLDAAQMLLALYEEVRPFFAVAQQANEEAQDDDSNKGNLADPTRHYDASASYQGRHGL
jgi:hypothetical protein